MRTQCVDSSFVSPPVCHISFAPFRVLCVHLCSYFMIRYDRAAYDTIITSGCFNSELLLTSIDTPWKRDTKIPAANRPDLIGIVPIFEFQNLKKLGHSDFQDVKDIFFCKNLELGC